MLEVVEVVPVVPGVVPEGCQLCRGLCRRDASCAGGCAGGVPVVPEVVPEGCQLCQLCS